MMQVMLKRRSLLVGAMSGLAGCAALTTPGARLPPLPSAAAGPYVLGPGDVLTIRIYDQPQLSGDFTIDDSGMIDMPLLGLQRAGGRTTDALAGTIAGSLQQKNLLLHPSVAAEISHYRPFYILGEVNTPGQYPYRPRMTVLTAVSIAGGFTYRAVQDYVGVTRDVGAGPAQYRAPVFALLAPGDVVTVFERRF